MPCCCAYGCHNRSEQGFKFYRFPTNHIRKAVWLNNIKRSGWTPSRFAVVCQEHFTDDQFENKRADGRRMLKWTGVPTLFFHRNEPKIQRSKPRESKKNPRSSIVLNSSGSSTAEHGNVQSDHTYSDMQPKGTMGTEKDQLLAKTVGKYKWLYHALNPSYKDTTMKRNSWNEVAQLVGVNVEECKARWTILRDRYVRFRKTSNMPPPSRVGIGVAPTPKWYLYPLMHSMLHNTIQHRSGDSLASTSAGSTTLESCVEDTSAPLVEIIVTDVDTHQPSVSVEAEATEGGGASSHPILTKKRKRQTDRDTLQNLHHLREKRPVMLEGLCQTSSDSDDDSEGGGPEGDDCIIKEEEEIDDSVHDAGSPAGAKPSKKITEPKTKLQNTRRKGRGIQKAKVKQRTGISRIFQPDQLRALKRVNMSEDHEDLWLPPTVKKALQLRFACRPTGYKQLLDHQFPLPSERTLQRKMQKVPFQPGVLGDIFDKLEIKVKEMNDTDRLCSLTLDELSLTPCVEYDADNGNLLGNVTLPQHTGMADHALVITLGGIITRWKQTVAYHYTNNMTDGTVLKEIILDIIEHANDIGLHVEAVTSDMGSASLAMWRSFGISCSRHCPTVHKIPQPQVPGKWLYFLAYVPHVLNNIKAAIVNENMLKLSDSTVEQHMLKSNVVSVEPLKDLAKFQEDLQSKLAPKLTMATLMPGHFDEKKASNATQVFSRDVSSGLKHLVNKEGRKEEYLTTAWLIQILSHWCKLMTNWHPVLALCRYDPEKYEETVYFLQKVIRIFESLKIGIGGDWEPIQTAVIISTYSVLDIAEALLDDDYKFLLTSTLTQDCLENLFSFVCLREPAPSPLEFKYALNMICVAQFLTLPSSDSYEKDEREFLADFLDQENIFLREPEVCKLNFSDDEHVESMAEHDSLHDLIGYCIHSIKNTEKTCDQCLKEVIAAPSRSAHHIAEEYRKGLVAVSEKAYVMFLRVEHMFRKAQNDLMEKTNVKRVLMDEAEIYAKDFELPTCHNIKNKLITKFIESRLHLYCRKKSDEYEKETGKEEKS